LSKAPTGIAGFDEITGGGFPRGRTTLSRTQPVLQALGLEVFAA